MLSAIISDSLLFKSPTCTLQDKVAAEELAKIAEVNLEEYGMELLKAGSDVSDYSDEKIVRTDLKEFEANGKIISITRDQHQIMLNSRGSNPRIVFGGVVRDMKFSANSCCIFIHNESTLRKSRLYYMLKPLTQNLALLRVFTFFRQNASFYFHQHHSIDIQ